MPSPTQADLKAPQDAQVGERRAGLEGEDPGEWSVPLVPIEVLPSAITKVLNFLGRFISKRGRLLSFGFFEPDFLTGEDDQLVTGTAGSSGHGAEWNSDGDLVTSGAAPVSSGDAAGGDLGGTYPSPTVVAMQAGALDAIGEIASGVKTGLDAKVVTGTAGSSGHGAEWNADGDLVTSGAVPVTEGDSAGGDLGGTYPNPTVTAMQAGALDALSEIASGLLVGDGTKLQTVTSAGADDEVPEWNSTGRLIASGLSASKVLQLYQMSKTISSGAVTLDSHQSPAIIVLTLDTEAAAATDDLETISGGAQGDILILKTTSATRDITLKHNTGSNPKIFLSGTADFVLNQLLDRAVLHFNSANNWASLAPPANNL